MDNYKLQISESMITMLNKAVKNKDEKVAKQIISKYFNDPKLVNRFLTALFSGKKEKITIKEMVLWMLDGNVAKIDEAINEETAYQAFFKKALKKFGVEEPDELSGDKEKEFYNYIDKNWKADDEKPELNEAVNISREVDRIAKMTDINDHIGALISGAKVLKHKKLETIFNAIADIQKAEGSLNSELGKLRDMYYKELMKYAKRKLSSTDYDSFYNAY